MGTEVLRPQDILIDRVRVTPVSFQRRKGRYAGGNAKPGNYFCRRPPVRPSAERSDQKKRLFGPPETTVSKRSTSSEDLRSSMKSQSHNNGGYQNSHSKRSNHINNLSVGQVTILRRGESLSALSSKDKSERSSLRKDGDHDSVLLGTERFGPDPQMVPKQIRLSPAGEHSDVYAGSAFSMSPSPRALPLPSFFNKKQVPRTTDDPATRDLRRLLRLE